MLDSSVSLVFLFTPSQPHFVTIHELFAAIRHLRLNKIYSSTLLSRYLPPFCMDRNSYLKRIAFLMHNFCSTPFNFQRLIRRRMCCRSVRYLGKVNIDNSENALSTAKSHHPHHCLHHRRLTWAHPDVLVEICEPAPFRCSVSCDIPEIQYSSLIVHVLHHP